MMVNLDLGSPQGQRLISDITAMQADIRETNARLEALERVVNPQDFLTKKTAELVRQAEFPVHLLDNAAFRAYVSALAPGASLPSLLEVEAEIARQNRAGGHGQGGNRP
jgi:hypothetical protein